jgi:uncharacterized protein (TIGR02265 family)
VTPEPERVVFAHTVKALLSRVFERQSLLTPQVREELAALGVNPAKPRDLAQEQWWKLIDLAARVLAPGAPPEEAYFMVGREMLHGFEATVIGRSLFLVLRMLGTRRAMLRVADHYRTADTVAKLTARGLGPTSVEVTVENTSPHAADYRRGVFLTALELVGARHPMVSFVFQNGTTVYTTSWE